MRAGSALYDAHRPHRCPALHTGTGGAPLDRLGKALEGRVRFRNRPGRSVWKHFCRQLLTHLLVCFASANSR
jgi:hypothetical protein